MEVRVVNRNRLRARIVERFGSQANFAQSNGLREPTVSRVINGRQALDIEGIRKWAKALGCKPEKFFIQQG